MSDREIYETINEIKDKTHQSNGVKENALLDLLKRVVDTTDMGGALRVTEISEIMGWTINKTRSLIRKLKARDEIEVVKVYVLAIDDTMRPAKAYRVKNDGKTD